MATNGGTRDLIYQVSFMRPNYRKDAERERKATKMEQKRKHELNKGRTKAFKISKQQKKHTRKLKSSKAFKRKRII